MKEQAKEIQQMFDSISYRYDILNRVLSFYSDGRWRKKAIRKLAIKPDNVVLDLATGTAEVMAEIVKAHPKVKIMGADFSTDMLKVAKDKMPAYQFFGADAEQLPFKDSSFDRIIIAFGFRNVTDKPRCLLELKRILKDDGKLVILELTDPENFIMKSIYRLYFSFILPMIGRLVSGNKNAYSYLPKSVYRFPKRDEYKMIVTSAGFKKFEYTSLTFGVASIALIEK